MKRTYRRTSPERASLDQLALSARDQLNGAVDTLLEKFVGRRSLGAQLRLAKSARTDLSLSYDRLRDVADALTKWHSDGAFLTSEGLARPLQKSGKASLASLAKQIAPTATATKILMSDLIHLGFVRRTGNRYLPSRRSAVSGQPNALILAHATSAVLRFLNTVSHNVSRGSPPRYERQVSDARICAADVPMFLRFVEQQGQYLIDSVDDWLSTRKAQGPLRDGDRTVGIGTFAWVEPSDVSITRRSRLTRKTVLRR